jgi:hypothetical protein
LFRERRQDGVNLSLDPIARPPETMIFAAVSSGRSFFAISLPTNDDLPESADRRNGVDRGRAAARSSRIEPGRADGDHFLGVKALAR